GAVVHVVSRSGGPGVFPSIQEALFRARPGDRVQVVDPTWEESVHLTGEAGAGRGVILEGAGDQPVVWRTPRGHRDDQPLVYLSSVAGLRLRNFTLDGQDRVKDLVAVAGPCPGLALEDLSLTGFNQSAVNLSDCSGEAESPVSLHHLRAVPTHTVASALRFEGRPGEGNRCVRVQDSRLEGPYQAAVTLTGTAIDVEFVHNRFFNATDGLFYRRATPSGSLGLTLASNTFCNLTGVAVRFETTPPPAVSRVTLSKNLFARTGTLARVDDLGPRPADGSAAAELIPESTGNVRDTSSAEGKPSLHAVAVTFELPTDPADDAHFLHYGRASMPALAGMPGVPPPEKPADKQ
ncbi:MAG TPA: hypothetical protein VKW77_10270, partial [Acidimicrobiales bacterium]|nr:hypothetical protein [Acidimicrobiales bacterium]